MSRIVTSAPGKLVLSGEYAVLAGAPALVIAVDRRVSCEIATRSEPGWQFRSTGFEATSRHELDALLDTQDLNPEDPARICQAILRTLPGDDLSASRLLSGLGGGLGEGPGAGLGEGLKVTLDSSSFYDAGAKLGLGSSAAVCVALTRALLELTHSSADTLAIALAAHRSVQGGRGSGLDVATACVGGLVEFQRAADSGLPTTVPRNLPAGVHLGFFWSGSSTATADHLKRFESWTKKSRPHALAALVAAATEVTHALPDADDFMRQLRVYSQRLRAMDEASGIGIYGETHQALAELAHACEVVYKPSGAGGGDIGIAIARSAAAIEAFSQRASAMNVTTLALGMEQHGIEVSRR